MIARLTDAEKRILKQLWLSNESLRNRITTTRSISEAMDALRRVELNLSTQDMLADMIANRIGARSVVSLSEEMVFYVAKQTAVHV